MHCILTKIFYLREHTVNLDRAHGWVDTRRFIPAHKASQTLSLIHMWTHCFLLFSTDRQRHKRSLCCWTEDRQQHKVSLNLNKKFQLCPCRCLQYHNHTGLCEKAQVQLDTSVFYADWSEQGLYRRKNSTSNVEILLLLINKSLSM